MDHVSTVSLAVGKVIWREFGQGSQVPTCRGLLRDGMGPGVRKSRRVGRHQGLGARAACFILQRSSENPRILKLSLAPPVFIKTFVRVGGWNIFIISLVS